MRRLRITALHQGDVRGPCVACSVYPGPVEDAVLRVETHDDGRHIRVGVCERHLDICVGELVQVADQFARIYAADVGRAA